MNFARAVGLDRNPAERRADDGAKGHDVPSFQRRATASPPAADTAAPRRRRWIQTAIAATILGGVVATGFLRGKANEVPASAGAIQSRRAVFDIGIAGPLAGLMVAVPVLYLSLRHAAPASSPESGIATGSSLFLALLYQFASGGDAGATAVTLSPAASAGWIGMVVTALNLLPVGQLDGGHISTPCSAAGTRERSAR